MSKEIKIKSGSLSVTISTLGAEIVSVKKGENELIWQADSTVWKGHAPLLFPVFQGFHSIFKNRPKSFYFQGLYFYFILFCLLGIILFALKHRIKPCVSVISYS